MGNRALALVLLAGGLAACSSPGGGTAAGTAGAGGDNPGTAGTASGAGQSGGAGQIGGGGGDTPGNGGNPGGSGNSGGTMGGGAGGAQGSAGATGTGGSSTGGTVGASGGSSGSTAGTGGAAVDSMDTPPWRALNVTATPGLHVHNNAGVDTRAKSLGKLGVNLGVSSGGYSAWLGRHGYHVIGASFGECNAPNLGAGRDAVGTCRLGEWMQIKTQVTATLKTLATGPYANEDWAYFFTDKNMTDVRWSDVAFTGVSHGATTAEIIARLGVRAWRAVSCAGPRDNTCGKGMGTAPFDPANPPYDPACPDAKIASWLDKPSLTPMDRYYALVGTTDVEYGDIMFNLERTHYVGKPVQWNVAGAVLTGTNRFYSSAGGHLDFLNAADDVKPPRTEEVLNIAFGIPPENQNPNF